MIYRSDAKQADAIHTIYKSLPPADRVAIDNCALTITEDFKARGLGRTTALEILYKIGRLMNDTKR